MTVELTEKHLLAELALFTDETTKYKAYKLNKLIGLTKFILKLIAALIPAVGSVLSLVSSLL